MRSHESPPRLIALNQPNGLLRRPPVRHSLVQHVTPYPGSFGPLGHGCALITHNKDARIPSIPLLLGPRRPPTVPRLVVPVHVDSVERVRVRWAPAHVCNERGKRSPRVTHANATRAVVGEPRTPRVLAALAHRLPHMIFARALESVGCVRVDQQTTARARTPVNQQIRTPLTVPATVARHIPKRSPAAHARKPGHHPATEAPPAKVHANGARTVTARERGSVAQSRPGLN